ncbi:glycoside hydrolase superfamily [Mycena epipterygia]|nr:glycoside hydrolase superfamily [Mycena epipterygia]
MRICGISPSILLLGASIFKLAGAVPISSSDPSTNVSSTDLDPSPPSNTSAPSSLMNPIPTPPSMNTTQNSTEAQNGTMSSSSLTPLPTSPPMNTTQNSTEAQNGTGGGTMDPPYFVVYAMDANHTAAGDLGPPPVEQLKGFNVMTMAFLLTNGTPAQFSQAEQWQNMNASQRTDIKEQYEQAGIKIFVSAFGSTEEPTTKGADANNTASTMAKWVKDYGVHGIDVDYEGFEFRSDMAAMGNGTAEQWVIDFTTQLYNELGGEYLITHARKIISHPKFSPPRDEIKNGGYRKIDQTVGHMINWVNARNFSRKGFYNSPGEDTTCDNLLDESGSFLNQTAVFEIHDDGQVPLEKIVIGKPATPADADSGYMNATYLNSCIQEASQKNWTTGIMFWQYSDAASGIIQEARGDVFPLPS